MGRLVKTSDRPRENRKKCSFLLKMSLEVDNFHGDAIDDLEKFKSWVANTFTQWDKSILEYFLYEYGLAQNSDSDKYYLDFKIESLLDDDTKDDFRPKIKDSIDEKEKKNNA